MAKKKESKQKKMNVRVDFTPMVDMMMLLITFFMLCTSLAKPQAMEIRMPAKQDLKDENKEKAKTELTMTLYLAQDNKLYSYAVPQNAENGKLEGEDGTKYLKEITWGVGPGSIRDALINYDPYVEFGSYYRRHGVQVASTGAPTKIITDRKKQLDEWMKAQPKANKDVNDSIYEKALGMIKRGKLDVVSGNSLNKAKYEEYINQANDPNFVEDVNSLAPTIAINIKPLDNCTYNNLVNALDEMAICCIGVYRIAEINDSDRKLLFEAGVPGVEAPATAPVAEQ